MNPHIKELYKKAYDLQYIELNYEEALKLYNKLIDDYPDSAEARYSKNQVEIIRKMDLSNKKKTIFNEEDYIEPPVTLTTANNLEGYKVVETIEIITSEHVSGINIFDDFITGVTDIIGGRSRTTQNILKEARMACLYDIKRQAYGKGANAVIAVNFNLSEFSGKNKSMLILIVSGTAVKVEKLNNR